MNPEQNLAAEVAVITEGKIQPAHWIDGEPTNIISLAESGLLRFPRHEAPSDDFTYDSYSPLNEW